MSAKKEGVAHKATPDGPLDMSTPVRHVATVLAVAQPKAVPFADIAASYTHPNTGDLSRIQRQHGDAVTWLIQQAIEMLRRRGKAGQVQIAETQAGYRLVVPFDHLRHEGEPIVPIVNDHAQLQDPFNPMTEKTLDSGVVLRFSENVRRRSTAVTGIEELRESMREFGWVEEFPAIRDERGVVLVGHRRLAVAKELGIQPVVNTVILGSGDAADAKRFRIAIVSNLASKPFTAEERKDLAEYLYGEREWVMERIAQALNVSVQTISNDLLGFQPTGKLDRPAGGRPAKAETVQRHQKILDLHAQGYSQNRIAELAGTSRNTVYTVLKAERARKEGVSTFTAAQQRKIAEQQAAEKEAARGASIIQAKSSSVPKSAARNQPDVGPESPDEDVLPEVVMVICPACNGSGRDPRCGGVGRIEDRAPADPAVPKKSPNQAS